MDASGNPISTATPTWSFNRFNDWQHQPVRIVLRLGGRHGHCHRHLRRIRGDRLGIRRFRMHERLPMQRQQRADHRTPAPRRAPLAPSATHVTIACAVNTDCNDNNPLTTDICTGGGAPGRWCANTPIPNQARRRRRPHPSPAAPRRLPSASPEPAPMSTAHARSYDWIFGDGTTSTLRVQATHLHRHGNDGRVPGLVSGHTPAPPERHK